MPTKKKSSTKKQQNNKVKINIPHPGKLLFMGVVALFAIIGAAFVLASQAAPQQTGTLSVSSPVAKLGNYVTFNATYSKNTRNPFVSVDCYQGNTRVLGAAVRPGEQLWFTDQFSVQNYTPGVDATCTGILVDLNSKGTPPTLASVTFVLDL